MQLQTERLIISPIREEDFEFYIGIQADLTLRAFWATEAPERAKNLFMP